MDIHHRVSPVSTRPGDISLAAARDAPLRLNLALQGGGSHGAFTWGVLDRLLDGDANLSLDGLSGTSAGAINAVLLADGWIKGGNVGGTSPSPLAAALAPCDRQDSRGCHPGSPCAG